MLPVWFLFLFVFGSRLDPQIRPRNALASIRDQANRESRSADQTGCRCFRTACRICLSTGRALAPRVSSNRTSRAFSVVASALRAASASVPVALSHRVSRAIGPVALCSPSCPDPPDQIDARPPRAGSRALGPRNFQIKHKLKLSIGDGGALACVASRAAARASQLSAVAAANSANRYRPILVRLSSQRLASTRERPHFQHRVCKLFMLQILAENSCLTCMPCRDRHCQLRSRLRAQQFCAMGSCNSRIVGHWKSANATQHTNNAATTEQNRHRSTGQTSS